MAGRPITNNSRSALRNRERQRRLYEQKKADRPMQAQPQAIRELDRTIRTYWRNECK